MFSQHPFTFDHRYSLDASTALPTWKRVLDLTVSLAALPLLGLLTFVFTLVDKLFSRGPTFYRQPHCGYMGRSYHIYRFRTMYAARHDGAGAVAAGDAMAKRAARSLIPGGRFLRASGLVDLPQIVNVLKGEMTLVGPRPSPALPGSQTNELHAVPGLTGLWRLAGPDTQPDETIRWERTYAERMSFATDVKLIARTVIAVIFRIRTH